MISNHVIISGMRDWVIDVIVVSVNIVVEVDEIVLK
jgi:hypothetical protein